MILMFDEALARIEKRIEKRQPRKLRHVGGRGPELHVKIAETSLVKKPANPGATFVIAKGLVVLDVEDLDSIRARAAKNSQYRNWRWRDENFDVQ